jgi:hypothetical protein
MKRSCFCRPAAWLLAFAAITAAFLLSPVPVANLPWLTAPSPAGPDTAPPEIHGIIDYVKPVLKADTVFDAYIRAGKKPAIVSTAGDSISCIFLERDMDYYICETYPECNKKAMELIEEDNHDLIVLYNGNYDTEMHRSGPESEKALTELKNNIGTYSALVKHIEKHWGSHRTMIGFCPDHGCHEIDGKLGSHGLDMAEDMNVIHFYKFL